MNRSEILNRIYDILGLENIKNKTDDNLLTTNEANDKSCILDCYLSVMETIARSYYKIIRTKEITVNEFGYIAASEIENIDRIYKILSFKDKNNIDAEYYFQNAFYYVNPGTYIIKYSVLPNVNYRTASANDFFPSAITEKIIAYGVAGEYLFLRGDYENASLWDYKFKTELQIVCKPDNEIILPCRRWQ